MDLKNQEILEGILNNLANLTMQVKALMVADKSLIKSEQANRYGFKPKHFDREFDYQGHTLKLVGFDPKSEKQCLVVDVDSGQNFRLKPRTVHNHVDDANYLEIEEVVDVEVGTDDEINIGMRIGKLRKKVKEAKLWIGGCQFLTKPQLVGLLIGTKGEHEQIYSDLQIKMDEIYK